MSDSRHTPEPWTTNGGRKIQAMINGEEVVIAVTKNAIIPVARGVTGYDQKQAEANARRIVACVNACREFSIESLEDDSVDLVMNDTPVSQVETEEDEIGENARHEYEFDESEEDDIITSDHVHFFEKDAGGCPSPCVIVPDGEDWRPHVKAWMEKHSFFPNVWFISDHGNAHLLSLED